MLVWGSATSSLYDPAANQWRRLPDPPTRHRHPRLDGPGADRLGRGLLRRRLRRRRRVQPGDEHVADAGAGSSQRPSSRRSVRGRVESWSIFNGHGPEGNRVGGAAYNPKTDTWRRIPSQSGIRALTAVYDGNEIYAGTGGPRVLAFNPSNNSWRHSADGGRRGRSRRGLDGQSPDRVRHGHQCLLTRPEISGRCSRRRRWEPSTTAAPAGNAGGTGGTRAPWGDGDVLHGRRAGRQPPRWHGSG